MQMKRAFQVAFAVLLAASACALEVVYDGRTPEGHRAWADRNYIREQMEVLGEKICKALYGDDARSHLHENFRITLYLAPVKGGNPAFAAGKRITWKVGEHPGGDGSGGMGLLCHEMTHVLDMGSDSVFTEAMADWVRNYKVHYNRCTSPSGVLDKRYSALRGGRHYGKYMAGANFIDFMTQNYGEGTIYRILQGYRKHGKKVWESVFGKTFDGLLAEWRDMETIYDPVFQWTYNGIAAGVVRNDGKFCGLRGLSTDDASDKSGAWLDGPTSGKVACLASGSMAIAMHGRFAKAGKAAIASLGSAAERNGKAVLLTTTTRLDTLAALVVASIPGRGRQVVTETPISVSGLSTSPHSIVVSVKGGDEATVSVDGKMRACIDMKSKCGGCAFTPAFAVGGMHGGLGGIAGLVEPRGKGGVLLDDVRVFTRAFRDRETALYAMTFNASYRGAVAVEARWTGPQGSSDIGDVGNWYCVNAIGERVFALPTKDTAVSVMGRALPSIPPGADFACRSFTVDGWAVADQANVDLRGVRIVDISDNARVITRDGHGIAVGVLRAKRVRLDGTLAVVTAMKVAGNLEMREGSVLRLPEDPKMAFAKSLSVRGNGAVVLRPGGSPKYGLFQELLRLEEPPKDVTRFKVRQSQEPMDAVFKVSPGGKSLGVTQRRPRR